MCGAFTSRKNRLHQRFTSIAAVASGIWSKYRNSDIASWISAICMDLSKVVIHGYKKKKKKQILSIVSTFVNINRDCLLQIT